MRIVGSLIFLLLWGHSLPAAAYKWTQAEMQAMPQYCQARFSSKDSALYQNWAQIVGPGFIHTHHYCDGLGFLNRYYGASTAKEKAAFLRSAYNSFMYVVPRVDQSYPMRPELYLNLGTALSLLKRDGEALQSMLKAIELDPKLARAYSATANLYEKLKKEDQALKIVAEGLRQNPGNSGLQRLYVKLGGQLPYPEPATPQEPRQSDAAEASSGGQGSTAGAQSESGLQTGGPAADPPPKETEATMPPKVGSPANPWCRFCPPEPDK